MQRRTEGGGHEVSMEMDVVKRCVSSDLAACGSPGSDGECTSRHENLGCAWSFHVRFPGA